MHCGYIYNLAQHACSSMLAAPLQQCSENFLLSHFDYNISYAMAKGVILMYLCKIWYKNMQVVCLDNFGGSIFDIMGKTYVSFVPTDFAV